jgi:hypothetical protein
MGRLRWVYLSAVCAWVLYSLVNPWFTFESMPAYFKGEELLCLLLAQFTVGPLAAGLVIGVLYRAQRGAQRDLLLHLAACTSLGLLAAGVTLIGVGLLSLGFALSEASFVCGTLAAGVGAGLAGAAWRWFRPAPREAAGPVLEVPEDATPSVRAVRAMDRRWAYGAVLAAGGVVALLLYTGDRPMRPATLANTEFWIDQLGATYRRLEGNEWGLRRRPSGEPARDALRRIGPDAVPIFIDALRATNGFERRAGAADGLRVYGAAARPAVPALVEAMLDVRPSAAANQTIREVALQTLLETGPGLDDARVLLASAVRGASGDADRPSAAGRAPMTLVDEIRRVWAAFALMWLDPWNRDAVAALLAGLTHDDVTVQNEAIVVLHRLGGGAKLQPIDDPIVETLVMTLLVPIENRRDGYTQGLALTILERLGPAAASARPALRTMLENAEEVTWRHRLQMTLSAIDSAR